MDKVNLTTNRPQNQAANFHVTVNEDHVVLEAELLENEIWDWVTEMIFVPRGRPWGQSTGEAMRDRQRKKLEPLIDPGKYRKQMQKVETRIERLKSERDSLAQKRRNLYNALEDGRFDPDELNHRLRKNQDEQSRLNDRILEDKKKLAELRDIEKYDQLLKDFETNKKDVLQQLDGDIQRLGPDDRKQLIEAVAKGRIKIITEEPEPGWVVPVVWWSEVERSAGFIKALKAFMDDGKINFPDKNSTNYSAAYYI